MALPRIADRGRLAGGLHRLTFASCMHIFNCEPHPIVSNLPHENLRGHFGITEMAPDLGEYEGMYPLIL